MKKPTQKEEIAIYRRLLIDLHTAQWTGHPERVAELMRRIGRYSYARTNTNGDWKQEERQEIETLLDLDK